MNWPPAKAWTSINSINGFNHFVAINYGGKGSSRWVIFVSVLDGNTLLRLSWDEIKHSSNWIKGWSLIESKGKTDLLSNNMFDNKRSCLHSSNDSGFQIPTTNKKIRKWR
tara:strand:- start:50 stop:379 length:330 start_codon:yes stop_codon:yes gene_type:complete